MMFSKAKQSHKVLNILSQIKRLLDKKENNHLNKELMIEVFSKMDLQQNWRVKLFGSYWDFHFFLTQPVIERQLFSHTTEKIEHKLLYGEVEEETKDFDISKPLVCTRLETWTKTDAVSGAVSTDVREAELLIYVPPSKEVVEMIEAISAT
jgi:hypothetical protein